MITEIIIASGGDTLEAMKECAAAGVRSLRAGGLRVREDITVCPDERQLASAVSAGLSRSNILILIGGMGHDSGFMSKRVISDGLRMPLAADTGCLTAIKLYCKRSGEPYVSEDVTLAELPRGAAVFLPRYGKLPGCVISSSRQHVVLLPENPREILPMLQRDAVPYLSAAGVTGNATHYVRAVGITYERVQSLMDDLSASTNPFVSVERDGGEVLVRVGAGGADEVAAAALCKSTLQMIAQRLGDCAYGLDVDCLEAAAVQKLRKKNLGIAIAEYGTCGMLTRVLSEIEYGNEVIRYAASVDDDKERLDKLGVSRGKIKKRGGMISEYAAVALANAAREKVSAEIGAAICAAPPEYDNRRHSGIVFIAVTGRDNAYVKKLVVSSFDESDGDAVIDAAVARALNMLRLFVDYHPERYHASVPLGLALAGKKTVTDKDTYDDNAFDDILIRPRQSRRSAVFGNLIIRKGDSFLTKMKKFIFILALITFLGSAGYVGYYYYESYEAISANQRIRDIFYAPQPTPEEVAAIAEDFPDEFENRFASLWIINPDIVGFLRIEGTRIDHPVVQGFDNQFYMRRAFDKSQSNHGVPFLDFRADVSRPSDQLVIYGHNMRDGQAFADLTGYRELDFYLRHPYISFDSLHRDKQYAVFAVFITNAFEDTLGHESVFNYHDMINAASDEDFMQYIHQLQIRSIIETGVDIRPGDKLLALSTCSYDFDDARFVVVARALREGEAYVDTSLARMNPSPLYPDIWYSTFGGFRPDVQSASVVTTVSNENIQNGDGPYVSAMAPQSPDESRITSALDAALSRLESSKAAEASRLAAEASQQAAAEASRLAAEASQSAAAESSRLAAAAEASRLAAEASRAASEAQLVRERNEAAAGDAAGEAHNAFMAALAAHDLAQSASTAALAREHAETTQTEAARVQSAADTAAAAAQAASTDRARAFAADARDFAAEAARLAESALAFANNFTGGGSTAGSGSVGSASRLTVNSGGGRVEGDALDIVSRIVQVEMGAAFHREALKAQAVAAYTFVRYANAAGRTPDVVMSSGNIDSRVKSAVEEVLGKAVRFNGAYAFTPYFATSNGSTQSSRDVWGGSYSYLTAVDSSIDSQAPGFRAERSLSRTEVQNLVSARLGISLSGNPHSWFEVIDRTSGGYNGRMSVGGFTSSQNSGNAITGRMLRENVFSLRSASFDVEYDDSRDRFTFITFGYGHGVGLSQNGANLYASQNGWSYIDILTHYYPGTTVS